MKPVVAGYLVASIGLVCLVGGWAVFTYAPGAIAARHARLEALPQPSPGSWANLPPGQEVLVAGRIADDQPVLTLGFVAYIREDEETDRNDNRIWKVRERQTPPLRLAMSGGEGVINRNYNVSGAATTRPGSSLVGTSRYTGFVAREAVVVHGHAADGGLEAIEIVSGTRASYLRGVADSVRFASRLSLSVAIGGAAVLVIGIGMSITAAVIQWRETGQ